MVTDMPWDIIGMDEQTWNYVKEQAKELGYPHVKARQEPQSDFFSPNRYTFMSGAPQAVIWKIVRERNAK
jgi:hypothetical protein